MARSALPFDESSEFFQNLGQFQMDRGKSLRAQVYNLMRRAIVNSSLKAGEPINEIAIAHQLNISRTPVREAVKKLSDEGLITIRVQHGTFISEINLEEIQEAYVIRIALELENIMHAAQKITQAQIYDLEDIIHSHKIALERERYEQAIEADDAFHEYIAKINGFARLWLIVEQTKAQMDRCRVGSLHYPGAGAKTVDDHAKILDALKAGNAKAARESMRAHLERSRASTFDFIKSR